MFVEFLPWFTLAVVSKVDFAVVSELGMEVVAKVVFAVVSELGMEVVAKVDFAVVSELGMAVVAKVGFVVELVSFPPNIDVTSLTIPFGSIPKRSNPF